MTEEQIHSNNGSYSAENIQVLEGLEAVRKRPAMYIGDISSKGLHHLVYEVVDNSIDEALAGYCDHIEVTINEDNSITVQDNGRGIPVDYHEKEKKSALEVVMTVLHAGGKFDKGSYKVSGGLHGVGVSCVNALSTHMTTQVFRNGKIYQQEYSCGHPLYSVKEVGTTDITGTRQQFWPDDTIFTETVYNYDILATRMRELAYLNAGIKISLTDLRVKDEEGNAKKEIFYSEEGLKEFVRYVDSSREHFMNDVIYINTEKQGTPVEVAIMYNTSYNENVHSYVNNINTIEGGTHLAGFRRALTRTLKKYAEDNKMLEKAKVEIAGSWSSLHDSNFNAYKIREKELYQQKCEVREKFNQYNDLKFTDFIKEADLYDYIKCAVCVKEYSKLKDKRCIKYIKTLKMKERFKYYLLMTCPSAFDKYKEIKNKLKK